MELFNIPALLRNLVSPPTRPVAPSSNQQEQSSSTQNQAQSRPTATPLNVNLNTSGQTQSTTQSTAPLPQTLSQIIESAPRWPVFQDIQLAQQTSQGTAQGATSSAGQNTPAPFSALLPNTATPAQIVPNILLFIAAAQSGDLSAWAGERLVGTLRDAGRVDLLDSLTREGQSLSRMASEPLSEGFRGLNIPLYHESEIQQIALYYKPDDTEDTDENSGDKNTRFIFDLSMSAMGQVQIDGLFRTGKLDLILRTQGTFTQDMRQNMRASYSDVLELSGLKGSLSFQNRPESFITPRPVNNSSIGESV